VLLVHRRRLLASLLAAPLSAFTATKLLAAAQIVTESVQADSDLSPGAVIAWEGNTKSDAVIDLWSGRVSDSDLSAVPPCVRRVIVWDDLFLHKSVHKTVDRIREAIPKYYGFDCRAEPSGSSFHLPGVNSFDEAIAAAFEAGPRARIALVDLDSCGVTTLDWLRIIPGLRLHYDGIAGFVRGLDEACGWLVPAAGMQAFFCASSLIAMQACDFGILMGEGIPTKYWEIKSFDGMDMLSAHARRVVTCLV
jgi:hypothetical protein